MGILTGYGERSGRHRVGPRALFLWSLLVAPALAAQRPGGTGRWEPPRTPLFSRHSGVVRLVRWASCFRDRHWVKPDRKLTPLGSGDWIRLSGSAAQADVLFPDLAALSLRRTVELQLLATGPKGHRVQLFAGGEVDVRVREHPLVLVLPGERQLIGRRAEFRLIFHRDPRRIEVRHVRGLALEVRRRRTLERLLDPLARLELPWPRPGPPEEPWRGLAVRRPPWVRLVTAPAGLRFEAPRAGESAFGILRLGDEVFIVAPGTRIRVAPPGPGPADREER